MKIKLLNGVNSAWLLLAGAVVLALLMSFAVLRYLQERERAIQEQVNVRAQGGPKIAVVVPRRDVPVGTPLTRDIFVSRPIDADLVYADMIKVTDFENYMDRKILHPIQRGRPLRIADVESVDRSLATAIPVGFRAITVPSDSSNSQANMLRPGDLVDLYLLATPTDTASGTSRSPSKGDAATLFLQQVQVLATGRQVFDRNEREIVREDGTAAASFDYDTLTLQATPEQAAKIALAQKIGSIRAVLRGHSDHATLTQAPLVAAELFASDRASQLAAIRTVQYIVGGRGDASLTNQEVPPALNALLASRLGLPGASGAAGSATLPAPGAASTTPGAAQPQTLVVSPPARPNASNANQPSLFFPNANGATAR